jgi:hypothetical protein
VNHEFPGHSLSGQLSFAKSLGNVFSLLGYCLFVGGKG